MEGEGLRVVSVGTDGVIVTDGIRTRVYVPQGEGPGLRGEPQIVNGYTEAGWFMEANCPTIRDGNETAIYIPARIVSVEDNSPQRLAPGPRSRQSPSIVGDRKRGDFPCRASTTPTIAVPLRSHNPGPAAASLSWTRSPGCKSTITALSVTAWRVRASTGGIGGTTRRRPSRSTWQR
jgi:hypothetical protein